MSDMTRLTTPTGELTIAPASAPEMTALSAYAPNSSTVCVNTTALLAAIDAANPDAMRAYLRETIPGDDAEGGVTAAAIEHEVPEADSPEDVDEQPARIDQAEAAQIDRSLALEKASIVLPSVDRRAVTPLLDVAEWIMTGERGDK